MIIFQQNINYNNINKNNIPNLNSIRSDYSYQNDNMNNNIEMMNNKLYNENLNKINQDIFILERNIPELTREYKNLANKINSNLNINDKENSEINLNALETQIKESKTKLDELKFYQQEILKNIYEV